MLLFGICTVATTGSVGKSQSAMGCNFRNWITFDGVDKQLVESSPLFHD